LSFDHTQVTYRCINRQGSLRNEMKYKNALADMKSRISQQQISASRASGRDAFEHLTRALASSVLLCVAALATSNSVAQIKASGAPATANTPGVPALGTVGVNCVISAVNRNAVVETDASYTVFNIPANAGALRGRVTCSDGSVGQTAVKFSSVVGGATIDLGPIVWGKIDPVPTALGLTAPEKRITTGGTSQLNATAIGINPDNSATTYNVTPRSAGTTYTISNDLSFGVEREHRGGRIWLLHVLRGATREFVWAGAGCGWHHACRERSGHRIAHATA
jgi:hypothetical protein